MVTERKWAVSTSDEMVKHRVDCEEGGGAYASPPCLMHELDLANLGLTPDPDPQQRVDVLRWRKAERQRLITARLAIDSGLRQQHGERIAASLEEAIGEVRGMTVSFYWPLRGEPDLRRAMERIASRGGRCALPVVIARGRPLIFRAWAPGDPLERDVWNIPVPAEGKEVTPEIVIAPVVGFDRACYRLGYGGGFFDRTLAAMPGRRRVVGVGYAEAAIPTIFPQSHDIPMDVVVTQDGIVAPRGSLAE